MELRQELRQQQRLILSQSMKQSLHFLKLPVQELSCTIREELTQNPLLEAEEPEELFDEVALAMRHHDLPRETRDDKQHFIENTYAEEESLFAYLLRQAKEQFTDKKELAIAEEIIGNLNEKGLFEGDLQEIALIAGWKEDEIAHVLKKVQRFEPAGIAARSIQESLLIQLKRLQRESSYRLIKEHYEDMLKNRIQKIAKAMKLEISTVYALIKEEIVPLELTPGKRWQKGHYKEPPISLTSDVTIAVEESQLTIDVNEEKIPHVRINERYLEMLNRDANEETKKYLQEKLLSGKSLLKNIYERNQTLYRITEEIATYQSAYFLDPHAKLLPMTMKELGERLSLHESTIARAVNGKYMQTPRGLLAMRSFFTHGYKADVGPTISSTSVKELVQEIIAKEDRQDPYSDEKIAELIQERGITCARRTIAKYRTELGLGNRSHRKLFSNQ